MAVDAAPAHRLRLTAAEIALLADSCAIELPPGFAVEAMGEAVLREAASMLRQRGVVVEADSDDPLDCRPMAPVAANLAVLAAPVAAVRVEVSVHGRGLRAVFAISGQLGASLFALGDGAVELSMFPAVALGRELVRAVPRPGELAPLDSKVRTALRNQADESLAGRLPLAALGEYDETRWVVAYDGAAAMAASLGLTAQELALAEQVTQRTTGTLWCLITGRGGDGVLVGQVVWLATDGGGWVGLRPDPHPDPDPDDSTRRMVVLQPVARDDIGLWLAPYLATILEVSR